MLAFGEINLKGKKYFRLQHTLKPKSARAKAACPHTLPPGAPSARPKPPPEPLPRAQSACFQGRLQGGLWEPARRPAAAGPPPSHTFSKDRISLNSLSWHRALPIRPCQPPQPLSVLSTPRTAALCPRSSLPSAPGELVTGAIRRHTRNIPRPPPLRSLPHSAGSRRPSFFPAPLATLLLKQLDLQLTPSPRTGF